MSQDYRLSVYNAPPIIFGKHYGHRVLREELSTLRPVADELRGEIVMNVPVDHSRRRLLTAATAGFGAVGIAFAAVPFIASWNPSERAKALGAAPTSGPIPAAVG